MGDGEYIEFQCIEVTQPLGKFYIGAINSQDLIDISYADVRRIVDREVEKALGIQRPLNMIRVKEIKKYVTNIDASFPTGIILAISERDIVDYNPKTKKMKLINRESVAKIIDGQHRIAGLQNYKGDLFQLNITIFVDMSLEDQAMMFATINLKQTKINKSLGYDLFGIASTRSPQKTCHHISVLLNSEQGSPFKDKLKRLGVADKEIASQTLTQANFVERLIIYLSKDPMKDRDLVKRGKKLETVEVDNTNKLIFRMMFIKDQDAIIAKNLWNYFSAVGEKWNQAWYEVKQGNILNRNTGFSALMRFLPEVYLSLNKPETLISQKEYSKIFKSIDLKDESMNSETFIPGGEGESKLFHELVNKADLN